MSSIDLPPVNRIIYDLARWIFRLLFRAVARVHVEGLEHLPHGARVILVCNHSSWMDGPLLVAVCNRRLRGLAAANYRWHPFGLALSAVGTIYVHRGRNDRGALRLCLSALNRNEAVAIAIEGTQRPPTAQREGKTGAVWLADKAQAAILPVGVFGTNSAVQKLRCGCRPKIGVAFGRPILMSKPLKTAKDLSGATELVVSEFIQLVSGHGSLRPAARSSRGADHLGPTNGSSSSP